MVDITTLALPASAYELPSGSPFLMASYSHPMHFATAMQNHMRRGEAAVEAEPPPPPHPDTATDAPSKELVSDMCKLIEHQSKKISTLREAKAVEVTTVPSAQHRVRCHLACNRREPYVTLTPTSCASRSQTGHMPPPIPIMMTAGVIDATKRVDGAAADALAKAIPVIPNSLSGLEVGRRTASPHLPTVRCA